MKNSKHNNNHQNQNQNHIKKEIFSMRPDSFSHREFTKKYALTSPDDLIFGFQANEFNLIDQDDYENSVQEMQSFIMREVKKMEIRQLKNNLILASITDDLQQQIQTLEYQLKYKICLKAKINKNSQNFTSKERKSTFSKENGKVSRKNSAMAKNVPPSQRETNLGILLTPAQLQEKFEAILKIRMHQQAINKILVFVHGKSQFRLVSSHFHIAQAYSNLKCSQQAIDHFTIALKKNSKIIEIKETKIFHSYIMTNLSKCYYDIQYYEDAIQILNRAFEIQQVHANSEIYINSVKTIKMISNCYLKLKNYPLAVQFIEKALLIIQKRKGVNTIEYVQLKFSKAVITYEEGALQNAIQDIKQSINLLKNQDSQVNSRQLYRLLIKFYKKLAELQQKFGDFQNQIYSYREIQNIIKKTVDLQKNSQKEMIVNILKTKRKIAILYIDHGDQASAIRQLQQISIQEIKIFGENSQQVYKTLRMIGIAYLSTGDESLANQYFKKSYKIIKTLKGVNQKQKQKQCPSQDQHIMQNNKENHNQIEQANAQRVICNNPQNIF